MPISVEASHVELPLAHSDKSETTKMPVAGTAFIEMAFAVSASELPKTKTLSFSATAGITISWPTNALSLAATRGTATTAAIKSSATDEATTTEIAT